MRTLARAVEENLSPLGLDLKCCQQAESSDMALFDH